MGIASQVAPIKIGVLFDFIYPPAHHWDCRQDFLDALRLVFDDATASGRVDRPIELVIRNCEGLPRGTVKAVIDMYAELVDEGCLAVLGPMISENAVVLRKAIDERFHVPAISWCGADEWLGQWTFALSNGSLPDEPFVLANLLRQAGHRRIGVISERSLIGQKYLAYFRQAAECENLTIVAEATIAQSAADVRGPMDSIRASAPDALLHLGFGLGVVMVNATLEEMGWDPPKYMGTSWEVGFLNDEVFSVYRGWIGLEQYDEENPVGQVFLDRFEQTYGRRPEYFVPGYGHDTANAMAHALGRAEPLSPEGVMLALEQVKMLPAASGAAGTRVSFGQWTRRGWMGAGYLIAREVAPDLRSTVFRGRLESTVAPRHL
jgi:branched-chain amino acid transport system substrate-binding protein